MSTPADTDAMHPAIEQALRAIAEERMLADERIDRIRAAAREDEQQEERAYRDRTAPLRRELRLLESSVARAAAFQRIDATFAMAPPKVAAATEMSTISPSTTCTHPRPRGGVDRARSTDTHPAAGAGSAPGGVGA